MKPDLQDVQPIVLYEDNHCLVVQKPWNLPVQPDDTKDPCLLDWVKDWIRTRYGKAGRVYVGLVHRLDRPASGVVLLTKTSKAASRLSAQFREGRIKKRYLVVVEGNPGPARQVVHYLKKSPGLNRTRAEVVPGRGRRSELVIEFVTSHLGTSLVELRLVTGRSHQIRAQLSQLGCPVIGDLRYGASRSLRGRNIALFAWEISFQHPTTKSLVTVSSKPLVEEEPWNVFRDRIESL